MKIAILGAGISGLSLAYFLRQQNPELDVTVFEKSARVGGVMNSTVQDGFFFEQGPRTFSTKKAPHLLQLIKEVGLTDALLFSSAQTRYLYFEGALRQVPTSLPKLLLSPLVKGVVQGILKDLRHPKGIKEDESIYSFVKRHAGELVAKRLVEPLVLGVHAGDYTQLSVSACFPEWKEYEYKYGSLLKGMYKEYQASSHPPLFTLDGGIKKLPEKLAELSSAKILLNKEVLSLEETEVGAYVNGSFFDHVVCALPAGVMEHLVPAKYLPFFSSFKSLTLSCVNVAFSSALVPKDGFGYLVPSTEKDTILGVIFDSSVFPQETKENMSRVTVMMRGEKNAEERALSALKRHLGISEKPLFIKAHTYKNYLPQLPVGHLRNVDRLQSDSISFIGNYIHGASVNRCINEAKQVARRLTTKELILR